MKDKIKCFFAEKGAVVIPIILVAFYLIVLGLRYNKEMDILLLQEAKNFDKMLETFVVFLSIVLSVYGFLIPSFVGAKGKTETIKYFQQHADMNLFASKLKNIVATGLFAVFLTCVLFLGDVYGEYVCNVIVLIWIWTVFSFMCNSYRFISLMINILLVEKKNHTQTVANSVTDQEKQNIDKNIRRI